MVPNWFVMLLPAVGYSALTFRAGIINFAFRMDVREGMRRGMKRSNSECNSDIGNSPNTSKVHFSSLFCVTIYLTAFSAWTQSLALRWPTGFRSRKLCLKNVCICDWTVPRVRLNWAPCYNLQAHIWSLCFLEEVGGRESGEIILPSGCFLLWV